MVPKFLQKLGILSTIFLIFPLSFLQGTMIEQDNSLFSLKNSEFVSKTFRSESVL